MSRVGNGGRLEWLAARTEAGISGRSFTSGALETGRLAESREAKSDDTRLDLDQGTPQMAKVCKGWCRCGTERSLAHGLADEETTGDGGE